MVAPVPANGNPEPGPRFAEPDFQLQFDDWYDKVDQCVHLDVEAYIFTGPCRELQNSLYLGTFSIVARDDTTGMLGIGSLDCGPGCRLHLPMETP